MKILFQGDSITDAGRNREDPHLLGNGYPKYAAEEISAAYPDREFEFVNLGISGDRAESLLARLQSDFIDVQPDIVSILIGVNDTWHHSGDRNWMPHEYFDKCYRSVLTAIKEQTHAKIIILEQFLLFTPDKENFREDLDPKIQITRALAREFADVFIPTDGLFAAASVGTAPTVFAADGVHPTAEGAKLMGKFYLDAIRKII